MHDAFDFVGANLDGKFRIDRVVGEGGFGVVYQGHHLTLDVPVAVKCLKVPAHFTRVGRELFLKKFRDEGKLLAKLADHPSITRVYDFGIVETGTVVPYLVLEWLDGQDLEQLLAERATPFTEQEARELIRPAIDALAFAHDHDVAHRDIKPANLFLANTKRGQQIKVLDFGIAKAMQEGETATQVATKTSSGFSAFSPQHGAPEQFRSKRYGATGPWTDVHAIGLVLVEMVTGRRAFEGEEHADFYEACMAPERPLPSRFGAAVSPAFEKLCAKALALSPKDRFANAGELLAALDDDAVEQTPPPTESMGHARTAKMETVMQAPAALQRPAAPVPRRESPWSLVATIAVLVGGVGIYLASREAPAAEETSAETSSSGDERKPRRKTATSAESATSVEATPSAPSTTGSEVDASKLPPDMGYLVVTVSPPDPDAVVAVHGKEVGKADVPNAVSCTRPAFVRVESKGQWLNQGQTVVVRCRAVIRIEMTGDAATRPSAKPEPPAPTPQPPSGEHCFLNANSLPASKVIIDGRPMGATPAMGIKVVPGPHTIIFKHKELGTRSTSTKCQAGETKTVSVRFR